MIPTLKLRTKLALYYAALFAALLGISGVAVYQLMSLRLRAAADDNLVDHVAGLWGYIRFADGKPMLDYDQENPYLLYFLGDATRYYQVYDARDGALLLQSEDSARMQLSLGASEVRRIASDPGIDALSAKVPLRFRSAVFLRNGRPYLLRVGVSVEADLADLAELRRVLMWILPIATSLAVAAAWWMAGRALRPLRDLQAEASVIGIEQLSRRLPHRGTNDELDSLATTFNQVLTRLDQGVSQMKNFASYMAHELRTPMTVLRGEVEVQLRRRDLPREWRTHLESHLEEFEKLNRLINRFLLVAKAETGGITFQKEPMELGAILSSLSDQLAVHAESLGITFKVGTVGSDAVLLLDHEWIERAFLNLLDNALKFTKPGGKVEITARCNGAWAVIEVADTGRGIGATDLPHIFEYFYRANETDAQRRSPGGLGLALTKWIVEQHRGTISVKSSEGKGSVFTVRLPLVHSRMLDRGVPETVSLVS